MDLDWEDYHRLNVSLLSAIGLWPYGNKFLLRIKFVVASFFAFSSCFFQLTTFLTVKYTWELLVRNLPFMIVGFCILLKYTLFYAAGDDIRRVAEDVNIDWKVLSDKEEIRIIEKYVERGKFHTKGFAMFIYPLGICLCLFPLSSAFLDIVIPLNESRKFNFPFMYEIFLDHEKHFFVAVFLVDCSVITAALTFVSTESLFIVYIQHACALFEVTSCRINKLLNSKRGSNAMMIAPVVDIHSRAIRHCKTVKTTFARMYVILSVFSIMCLSVYVFLCARALATHDLAELFTYSMFLMAILGYVLYLNFVTQGLLDSSGDIFNDFYDTEWYDRPISTRKLVLFCMLNSIKLVTLDIYSMYVPSYEGSGKVVKMVMSFATALYSLQ